jgi:oligopeptide transport system substrate-binding protein
MGRLLSILAVLVGLCVGALVWSGGGVVKRADFTFINRGNIYTLDLNQMSYMQDFRMTYAIREGLYSPHPETFQPIPAGAVRHETSADGLVWTFHLRPESKWSNGEPVTARDYVFSWRRMLEEPGEYTYLFYYIRNAEKYQNSYAAYRPIPLGELGMEAVGDHVLKVTLASPLTYMLDVLAFPPFYPRHEGSMLPFRTFTDADVMNVLDRYVYVAKDIAADAAGAEERFAKALELPADRRPEAKALQAFLAKARAVRDVAAASERQVLELLPDFAALRPLEGQKNKEAKAKLEQMLAGKMVKYSFRSEYTRPPASKGAPGVVTNGAFNLVRWDFKRRLILEKSATYWDRESVKCERIEQVENENKLSQFLQYEAGHVDWLAELDPDVAAELKAEGRSDLSISPAFGTAFLTFLCREKMPDGRKNPLADVRVRQALAMSIDKRFIVENVTRMGELPARTYLPADGTLPRFTFIPGPYDKTRGAAQRYSFTEVRAMAAAPPAHAGPGLPYDVAEARRLLAEAGYPDGRGFPVLPVLYNNDSTVRQRISEVLKSQWKEKLNITVEIDGIEGKIRSKRVSDKDYVIAPVGWFGDYPDVSTFTDKYRSTGLQNDSDWKSPEYDALLDEAAKEPDAEKRMRLLETAENMIDTQVPIVPLYYYVNTSVNRPHVLGVQANPRSMTIFKAVRVQR